MINKLLCYLFRRSSSSLIIFIGVQLSCQNIYFGFIILLPELIVVLKISSSNYKKVIFIGQFLQGQSNNYSKKNMFECMRCAEGCDECIDDSPCIASLNWVLRTIILALSMIVICCLPLVVFFTWKYGHLKVTIIIISILKYEYS